MSKKILTILSNFGYWGVELTGPMVKLEEAGYELEFVTPNGARPIALPPSYDTEYMDPPLGVAVTTEFDANQVQSIMDDAKLDNPLNISEWVPERPYPGPSPGMHQHLCLQPPRDKRTRQPGFWVVGL